MLDQVLALFSIRPDENLDVMRPDQELCHLTSQVLVRLDPIIKRTRPHSILAQGDTTMVLVAALAPYYHHVRFGHVEAGLRTGNHYHPFPEEGTAASPIAWRMPCSPRRNEAARLSCTRGSRQIASW